MDINSLNNDELKDLILLKSRSDICDEFLISRRTLSRLLKSRGLTNFGVKRLDDKEVKEIRHLYFKENVNQTTLSQQFNVSQSLISKIVNDEVHKKNSIVVGGSADVKIRIGYKYGNS